MRRAITPHRHRLVAACFASFIACPVAAKAPPEPGPMASASIRISLSIARRYGLATGGESGLQRPEQLGRDQLCLASNGGETPPSVMLITSAPGQADEDGTPATGRAIRLLPCGSSSRRLDASAALEGAPAVQVVLISPE